MSEQSFQSHYVGPERPPEGRRPPISEIGLIGWLRKNLFNNVPNAISTLITLAFILIFLYDFLNWAIFSAQWEVVFLNLTNIGAGPEYPKEEMWRIELSAFIIVFLVMLSVGFWGRIQRWIFAAMGLIGAAMIIIPLLTQAVPEPPIAYYTEPGYINRQVNFIAEEGQEITFTIDPLIEPDEFGLENIGGYIADDNQLTNTSWDAIAAAARGVDRGQIDSTAYDMSLQVQVWDAQGEVIYETPFTEGNQESESFTWEAPDSGWYTFTMVEEENEEFNTAGVALLRVEDLEVYYNTNWSIERRQATYGLPPELECSNCATEANRTDMRFSGERTLPQYFSLQLGPYLLATRQFYFISLVVGLIGYFLGQSGKYRLPRKWMTRGLLLLWAVSIPIQYVISVGIEGNDTLPEIDTTDFGGLFLTLALTVVAIIGSFPIGIALALGRQSELPVIKFLCTIFIETIRGVPLITLLFAGRYIVLFMVDGLQDTAAVVRMAVVLTLFTGAYLAEVIRGGLQIIPKGQLEAARALGLTSFQTTLLIVLPQALRAVIPAIMGQFVSIFKDTSLVALVGIFEITGAMRRILSDTATGYTGFQREGYLYIAILYFIFSYLMAAASRNLERSGAGAVRTDKL